MAAGDTGAYRAAGLAHKRTKDVFGLGGGKPFQFRFAPLQDTYVFQEPLQPVPVQRLDDIRFHGASCACGREGIFQPTYRPLPGFLLETRTQRGQALSYAACLGDLMSQFDLHLLQMLRKPSRHRYVRNYSALKLSELKTKLWIFINAVENGEKRIEGRTSRLSPKPALSPNLLRWPRFWRLRGRLHVQLTTLSER